MRVGIDARFWGQAGPGRYVKNLVLALEKVDPENEYVVFLNLKGLKDYRPLGANFRKVRADIPWYSFAEQIELPLIFAREKLDLLHVPHYNIPIFYPGRIAITIHDLTIHRFSTARATTRWLPIYRLKRLAYYLVFFLAIKRAKIIFVPTEFVRKDLLEVYPWLSPEKILVTYEGAGKDLVDGKTRPSGKDGSFLSSEYGIRKPYLLYVGSMYPHKNLERLIEAFGLLAEEYEDLSLVLVGKRDFFQERLREKVREKGSFPQTPTDVALSGVGPVRVQPSLAVGNGLPRPVGEPRGLNPFERIVFPAFNDPNGYVPDCDLAVIYRNALLFVFPSLSEGFGLPPLEAMSFGIPVAASRATCIPEVCGEAALYFNPEDTEDIARKMKSLISNPALRRDLIQKGFENLKRFSWEKTARGTLEGYKSCSTV